MSYFIGTVQDVKCKLCECVFKNINLKIEYEIMVKKENFEQSKIHMICPYCNARDSFIILNEHNVPKGNES